jgi:flagellar protein FliS
MNASARNAYLGNSVQTASPARLLVMLCDRLVLDLQRGRDAQAAGVREEANSQLLHAQDILIELRSSLDTKAWAHPADLGQHPQRRRGHGGRVDARGATPRHLA